MQSSPTLSPLRARLAVALVAALSLSAAGCGDGRPKRVPVSGRVTIDGEPLTYGFVRFHPQEGGRLGQSRIGPDGRFSLTTYDKGDGVTVGTHAVEVLAGEPVSDTKTKWHAPKKYAERATSELTVTIEKEEQDLPIELTWGGGKVFVEATP